MIQIGMERHGLNLFVRSYEAAVECTRSVGAVRKDKDDENI